MIDKNYLLYLFLLYSNRRKLKIIFYEDYKEIRDDKNKKVKIQEN